MSEEQQAPIIIIKKRPAHHGHHGGAWKVAYADFVTAMMALFIVLWLLSSDEKVKQAVGGYFTDPSGSGKQVGSTMAGTGESVALHKDDMKDLKDKLESAMNQSPELASLSRHIMITITGEGLRIELLEDEDGVFFESASAKPTEMGTRLVTMLAAELGRLPNKLSIEGHTDAKPFNAANYSNWELSADRANAARRVMQEHGVRPDQVAQIRGFADQRLRTPEAPDNPANRRITVIVQYLKPPPERKVDAAELNGQKAEKKAASGH